MRGLHIVVFDTQRGFILHSKAFDLYKSTVSFDDFIRRPLADGNLVIAACKDDISTCLSDEAKTWFAEMGSKDIFKVGYRHSFAFIGTVGETTCLEKSGGHKQKSVSITQVIRLNIDFKKVEKELEDLEPSAYNWPKFDNHHDILTKYLHQAGMSEEWGLTELAGFDDVSLEKHPKPTVAVLVQVQRLSDRDARLGDPSEIDLVDFYMDQAKAPFGYIGLHEAAGVFACLHGCLNNLD